MMIMCWMMVLLTTLVQLESAIAIDPCIGSCTGVADGDYQSCNGCNVYMTCSNGIKYDNRPCATDSLVWDDYKKRCEYESETCSSTTGVIVDFCGSNPCKNGGVCIYNSIVGYTCSCPSGFTGVDCTVIDYCKQCVRNPCMAGGECTNGINSYSCSYPYGYVGTDCKTDVPLSSCKDVYDRTRSSGAVSGEYYLTNCDNQQYKVYCEFYDDHIYTFVAPNSLQSLSISKLYNNQKEVLIRYRMNNGYQYQSTIGQLARYSSRNISIQYNAHVGYNSIRNSHMNPYMYVGLLPIKGINHGLDRQGYSVNGEDKAFTNCNGNANSYFAVLYNAANARSYPYNLMNIFMQQWIIDSQPVDDDRYLPAEYFSFFEMHMGGCGGYMTLDHLPDMAGLVFGLKYDLQ